MKQPVFVGNTPIDEKRISFIEKIVARLARRTRSTARAVITPSIISGSAAKDDTKRAMLKHMFIGSGVIKKGKVWLSSKPKAGASLVMSIEDDLGVESKSYAFQRRDFLVEPAIEVQSGDRLTVSVFTIDPEDHISECWVSLQFVPEMKDSIVKQYLFDEIEEEVLGE